MVSNIARTNYWNLKVGYKMPFSFQSLVKTVKGKNDGRNLLFQTSCSCSASSSCDASSSSSCEMINTPSCDVSSTSSCEMLDTPSCEV